MIIPMLLALVKAVPFRSPIYGLLTSCLVLLDKFHHFPVRSQVLVENHVIAVDEHLVARPVNFATKLDEVNAALQNLPAGALLKGTGAQIINISEAPQIAVYRAELAEINLPVIQENGLKRPGIADDELLPARENVQQNRDGEDQDDPKNEPQFLEPRFFLKKRRGFHRLTISP